VRDPNIRSIPGSVFEVAVAYTTIARELRANRHIKIDLLKIDILRRVSSLFSGWIEVRHVKNNLEAMAGYRLVHKSYTIRPFIAAMSFKCKAGGT